MERLSSVPFKSFLDQDSLGKHNQKNQKRIVILSLTVTGLN